MHVIRWQTSIVAMVACAASVVGQQVHAGENVEWIHSSASSSPMIRETVEDVAAYIKERSDGRFRIQVYDANALSKPEAVLDLLRTGEIHQADFCASSPSDSTELASVLSLPLLPLPEGPALAAVVDRFQSYEPWVAELQASGLRPYIGAFIPSFELLGRGNPPREVGDWKGLRLRAPPSTSLHDAAKRLGAAPTSMAASELYSALQTGVTDAAVLPFAHFGPAGLGSDWYATNLNLQSVQCPIIQNAEAFSDLPQQFKEMLADAKPMAYGILLKHYQEARQGWLKEQSVTLKPVTYSDEQLAAFRSVGGEPLWKRWAEYSADPSAAQEALSFVLTAADEVRRDTPTVPLFMAPPPDPSDWQLITEEVLQGINRDSAYALQRVADRLESAIRLAGYQKYSYYQIAADGRRVPGAFAIAAMVENIDRDGMPMRPRFGGEELPRELGLRSMLAALLTAREGFYRIVVFTVMPDDYRRARKRPTFPTLELAREWIGGGRLKFPAELNGPLGEHHEVIAWIYMFRKPGRAADPEPHGLPPTATMHLQRSGLSAALTPSAGNR